MTTEHWMDPFHTFAHREPSFERLRTALFCGEPDFVPAVELLIDKEVKEAFLGHAVTSIEDDVEFFHAAGYDYYDAWVGFQVIWDWVDANYPRRLTVTAKQYEDAAPREWASEAGGLIKSMDDFEAFPWPDPDSGSLVMKDPSGVSLPIEEGLARISEALPHGMGTILCTDGIFERFTKDLMGYTSFCYALHDEPELIWRMFAKVGELWLGMFRRVAAMLHVDGLWLADDIAYGQGLMFDPIIMRKHLFPWYSEIGNVAHARELPFLFHSDGDIRPVLGDLVACGIDAIQPIEPKAMDIRELKRDYLARLCLIGNIDLGGTLSLGTPDDVRAEVGDRIQTIAPGGGYCVGSSNSVTNYVPLANYKAMLEATFEYGKYPVD